jgi:hypothetical protein
MGAKISRRKLAERHDVVVRSIERRQASDPNYPKSTIINGRHYFDLDEVEIYERRLASAPQVRRAAPAARPQVVGRSK